MACETCISNNSVQDSTYLSEKICREMFEAAGVPSPRAGHAVVEFDGRLLGLYVLVEGIDNSHEPFFLVGADSKTEMQPKPFSDTDYAFFRCRLRRNPDTFSWPVFGTVSARPVL